MSEDELQEGAFEVIHVPDIISERVMLNGPNAVDVDALDKMDMAFVEKISNNYLAFFHDDLEALKAAFSSLSEDRQNREKIEHLYTISHDIKGQAGSFGFDLITAIADLLCSSIENMDAIGDKQLEIIGFHVEAMRIAEMKKMKGMGGPAGEKLFVGLQGVVSKVMRPNDPSPA